MSYDLKLIQGDLQIASGDLAIVEKSDKLVQDILKILSTQLGANPFFPWYGSPISRSLIGTALDYKFVSQIASSQLQSSLETLQGLQKEQLRITPQLITPEEQIAAIQDVSVLRSNVDPRFYQVRVTVLNKAFRRVPAAVDISI